MSVSRKPKVAIVGYGVVGQAYSKLFPDAVLYDPFSNLPAAGNTVYRGDGLPERTIATESSKEAVNECDIALVAVFTKHLEDGSLDTSILEEVVDWIETPLILVKSACQPGTIDRLVEKTGKKIAVSVEFIGEGTYPIHFWKYPHQNDPRLHQMLIVGGEQKTAEACAEILWSRMSPDVKIHITSALEAEITKLVENSYGALKVTFINTLMSLAQKSDTSFVRMHQAWQSDPRTDSMHLRAVSFDRGWRSKCWDKDVPALVAYAESVGASDTAKLFQTVLDLNESHLEINEED
jgi:UDP-glucose 6-dehydrogenase